MDVKKLVEGLLSELKKVTNGDAVVGQVRDAGSAKVLPLSRVSIGFGAGVAGADGKADSRAKGDANAEGGGAGGAIVVEPRAFVVIGEDGGVHMLAMKRGKAAVVRRGIEILGRSIDEHLQVGAEPSSPALGAGKSDPDAKND
jgi:uncharacterized spore protein YtfJ